MTVFANAKINLSLDVVSKRPDGYHEVSMIMQEVDLCDTIEIEQADGDGIELFCRDLACDRGNIVYRAAESFYSASGIKAFCRISLEKKIPVCAGLGGGSSDAAATLKALNEINGFALDEDKLSELALKLGADVPFFLKGGTALAQGIGEKLTPLPSPEKKWVVLIKPDIDISTPEAYREIDSEPVPHPDTQKACECLELGDIIRMYEHCGNSFEEVSRKKHPEIDIIKSHLYAKGAEFAMMSGSGPTVFGIFSDEDGAREAFSSFIGKIQGGVARFV